MNWGVRMINKHWGMLASIAVVALILTGCGSNSSQAKKNSSSASSSAKVFKPKASATNKTAVKATASATPSVATTALSPIAGKYIEDKSTQQASGVTYSNFYWKNGAWHWVQSISRGNVQEATVKSATTDASTHVTTLKMDAGTSPAYDLTLTPLADNLGYHVENDKEDINNSYMVGDTDGQWTSGAPTALQGNWVSGFVSSSTALAGAQNKDYPYAKIHFSITADSTNGVNVLYHANKKTDAAGEGAGWGANSDLSYKALGNDTYLLKSYNGTGANASIMAYKVTEVSASQIDILFNGQSVSFTPDKTAEANGDDSAASASSSTQGATDTTHLTAKQVNDWVWADFQSQTKFKQSDYLFDQEMDGGVLVIRVMENHSTPDMKKAGTAVQVTPTVAQYRINNDGQLQITRDGGLHYKSVSTPYPD